MYKVRLRGGLSVFWLAYKAYNNYTFPLTRKNSFGRINLTQLIPNPKGVFPISDYILPDKKNNIKNGIDNYQKKKIDNIQLSESFRRLGFRKRAKRVADCSTFLEFHLFATGERLLSAANFCKVRLCPMCAWRRSLKIFGQVSQVMDKVLEAKEYRFIFLTLTCRNVAGEELSATIDSLFLAFNRLTKRKKFKLAIKGWFRALEVTHNLVTDTYHPHFHIILAVTKSYFTDPKYYLSQARWTDMWQSCLQVDYNPIVDVRTFEVASKKVTARSVAEVAKYTVKSNDYLIPDDLALTDRTVRILNAGLAHRRLVAFGGILRDIHRNLKLDDPVAGKLTDDRLRDDVSFVIERYRWHVGYRQYKATD